MIRRISTVLLAGGLVAASALPVSGQVTCGSIEECPALVLAETGMRQELTAVAVNAFLGGATAAVSRWIRGDSPWSAFWQGAAGGGLAYAGKRVAVEPFDGAGFLGRELVGVGGSMIRNVSDGRGLLDELVLPVGPVRLHVSRGRGVVPKLDLSTLIVSGAFVLMYDARLDVGASLSSGSMMFRGSSSPMPGLTAAGATMLWRDMPAGEGPRLAAHERVHILQYDQMYLMWGQAMDRWVARKTSAPAGLFDHVELGLTTMGLRAGMGLALDYHSRPWENEAYFLAQQRYPITPEY